ncbi:MAG: hypothetical protein ACK4ND_13880 [Cytophagaceae bacterium]
MEKKTSDLKMIKKLLLEKLDDIQFKEKCLLKRLEDLQSQLNDAAKEEEYIIHLVQFLESYSPGHNQTIFFKEIKLHQKEISLNLN